MALILQLPSSVHICAQHLQYFTAEWVALRDWAPEGATMSRYYFLLDRLIGRVLAMMIAYKKNNYLMMRGTW